MVCTDRRNTYVFNERSICIFTLTIQNPIYVEVYIIHKKKGFTNIIKAEDLRHILNKTRLPNHSSL